VEPINTVPNGLYNHFADIDADGEGNVIYFQLIHYLDMINQDRLIGIIHLRMQVNPDAVQ